MGSYELVVLLKSGLKQERKDEILAKIKTWVKQDKGKVTKEIEWGMRTLEYPIDKHKDAFYYFFTLEAKGNPDKTLQEKVEMEGDILRYLLVRRD